MKAINYHFVPETDSTNDYVRCLEKSENCDIVVAYTDFQTKGRGQGSNKWESERGKNLTFSMLCHPIGICAAEQFILLQAESLAIKEALEQYIGEVTVKWPNDIYYKDSKISGTLIECVLRGNAIATCVLGTGIDVNQQRFVSDAPNPISLFQILGHEVEREPLLRSVAERFALYLEKAEKGERESIRAMYMQNLYRRNGCYAYRDAQGEFAAEIAKVEADGSLVLRLENGELRRYAFKEVSFII